MKKNYLILTAAVLLSALICGCNNNAKDSFANRGKITIRNSTRDTIGITRGYCDDEEKDSYHGWSNGLTWLKPGESYSFKIDLKEDPKNIVSIEVYSDQDTNNDGYYDYIGLWWKGYVNQYSTDTYIFADFTYNYSDNKYYMSWQRISRSITDWDALSDSGALKIINNTGKCIWIQMGYKSADNDFKIADNDWKIGVWIKNGELYTYPIELNRNQRDVIYINAFFMNEDRVFGWYNLGGISNYDTKSYVESVFTLTEPDEYGNKLNASWEKKKR